ncbi:MAG: sigma-70 family RNA polymerase sigma factor [Pseudomonadota bacterium]
MTKDDNDVSPAMRFEELVETHASMVRRIASVYERHPDQAEDLAQETWLAVWSGRARLDAATNLKAYIARITQNICVTHVRRAIRQRTEPMSDILSDSLSDGAPTVDEAMDQAQRRQSLLEAVRALPDGLKAVASLYLEGLAIGEIASALGLSETNTSVRLHRARAALRIRLGEPS